MWKPIEGYEGLYEVSRYGLVRNICTNKTLSQCPVTHSKSEKAKRKSSNTYIRVRLYKDGFVKYHRVHILVAKAFIDNPNPDDYNIVNHEDGNTYNNCWWNLAWCNTSQNTWHYHNVLKVKRV